MTEDLIIKNLIHSYLKMLFSFKTKYILEKQTRESISYAQINNDVTQDCKVSGILITFVLQVSHSPNERECNYAVEIC